MCKLLRRLFLLAFLGGAGYAVFTALQRRRDGAEGAPPEWPPFDTDASVAASGTSDAPPANAGFADPGTTTDRPSGTESGAVGGGGDGGQRWAEPVDGQCPVGYPIKGNDDSGIYHVPGGRFYERTIPERCYANEDDAIADGYRRSKA